MQYSMTEADGGSFRIVRSSGDTVALIERVIDGRKESFWIQSDLETPPDAPVPIIGPYASAPLAFQAFADWAWDSAVLQALSMNDMVATECRDGTWAVMFRSTQGRVGVLRWASPGWVAIHANFGTVGTFETVLEGMAGLWEAD